MSGAVFDGSSIFAERAAFSQTSAFFQIRKIRGRNSASLRAFRSVTVTATVLIGLTACHSAAPSTTQSQSVPGPATSIMDTAKIYLNAAVARNCSMTRDLTDEKSNAAWAWCKDPTMLSYKLLRAPQAVPSGEAPVDEQCVFFTMTNTESSDHSISAGTQPWGLCFTRTSAGWRVYSQGPS